MWLLGPWLLGPGFPNPQRSTSAPGFKQTPSSPQVDEARIDRSDLKTAGDWGISPSSRDDDLDREGTSSARGGLLCSGWAANLEIERTGGLSTEVGASTTGSTGDLMREYPNPQRSTSAPGFKQTPSSPQVDEARIDRSDLNPLLPCSASQTRWVRLGSLAL
jgi:hypothetical protein